MKSRIAGQVPERLTSNPSLRKQGKTHSVMSDRAAAIAAVARAHVRDREGGGLVQRPSLPAELGVSPPLPPSPPSPQPHPPAAQLTLPCGPLSHAFDKTGNHVMDMRVEPKT